MYESIVTDYRDFILLHGGFVTVVQTSLMVGSVLYLEYHMCAAVGNLCFGPMYCSFHFLHSHSKT
jgi:hypothetical protein